MSWRKRVAVLLIGGGVFVAMPVEAEAQGFLDWIHRMSGPEFPLTSVGARIGVCVNAAEVGGETRRCVTLGSGVLPPPPDVPADGPPSKYQPGFMLGAGFIETGADADAKRRGPRDLLIPGQGGLVNRPIIELQIGFAGSYSWSGDNDDRGIENVRMLVLEPQLQAVFTKLAPVSFVGSIGVGAHRFWSGTVPDPFWSYAPIIVVALRYEWGGSEPRVSPKWYVQAGWKYRYFFDRIPSARFGGTPDPGVSADSGEGVQGFTVGFGYRFTIAG